MKNIISSYTELLEKAGSYYDARLTFLKQQAEFYRLIYHKNSLLNNSMIYLIDYVSCKYPFMLAPKNCWLGHALSYLMEAGPTVIFEICHPEDFQLIDKTVCPANFLYLKTNRLTDAESLSFTITYRIKGKDGLYYQVKQSSCYIALAEDRTPLAALGWIVDITPYKKDTKLVHIIEDHSSNAEQKRVVNYFYPQPSDFTFTKREIEVLKWVCEGYSSKQIADKLFLSIHTINNHRKNLLEKTNCKNLMEVLSYAIKSGII